MKIFSIDPDDTFTEYSETPFESEHEEHVLESWVESNPDLVLEDSGVLIIGRQVSTNLGGLIDLLGLDRQGDVVVIELKRDRTPRHVIAQALEYASYAALLDAEQLEEILRSYQSGESLSLAEHHQAHFELAADEAVAFNKNQHIVVIGQRITDQIRQTASYLNSKGIGITCVEFTYFEGDGDNRLMSQQIVVGKQLKKPTYPITNEQEFRNSLDENGRALFSRILEFGECRSMRVNWGIKGFSLNVDLNGTYVAICFCYPPGSSMKQSCHTALYYGVSGVERRTNVPEEVLEILRNQAEATGIFNGTWGKDLNCDITRRLADAEINSFIAWCESVEQAVRKYGLKD